MMKQDSMMDKVLNAVKEYKMFECVKSVTVAFSGGADSVTLLSVLFLLKDTFGFTLSAAHFNHKIRGEEADRDQKFCEEFCKAAGIKIIVGNGDVLRFAEENKISTELAARKLRYKFLNDCESDVIALAHTASDNLETVIFNLTRGAGTTGLGGIPAKRGKYIRPLIYCTRADIEEYCKSNSLPFVTDSTNLSDDYTRNMIRHKVVPVLKSINPSVEKAVINTSKIMGIYDAFLKSSAKEFLKDNIKDGTLNLLTVKNTEKAVVLEALKIFYKEKCNTTPDSERLNALYDICVDGGKLTVSGGKTVESNKKMLNITGNENVSFSVEVKKQKNVFFGNIKKVNNLLLKNAFDCDKIVGNLTIRTRNPGDKMRLANKVGTKSFKKLYNEYKIPACERQNLPVIADDEGPVWIYKIGVADRCAVNDETKNIYTVNTVKQNL